MKNKEHVRKMLEYVGNDFFEELEEYSIHSNIAARQEIIAEGEKIAYIPILLKGSVKVYSLYDDRELLYYYIKPFETCTMTFSSIFTDAKSRIYACAEQSSEVLLLPTAKVLQWLSDYPALNQFFFKEYDKRYSDIMRMVTQAVFHKLDKRIIDLLDTKIEENGGDPVKISHKEIANILGTAREVVSRILKKFENEGVITQSNQCIGFVKKK
ncbi:Crp/Fnr family transcriptional regulator [Chryseobacterium aquaticum]|uniref:Crp/Fnr family transcriptional regulator n=1 Tax=Chryseobacterium aquaticum TaxID=452084 RepID=A0A0Q3LSI5_9FLAO|nr:Crp/Fnr family transcriptional regulator [Chryseobacterium aquaticum]KQK26161.1 Crp/Fnr family transcriptional regulator [Chryseobacterium aquaticum]